jgi:hypothetical protein
MKNGVVYYCFNHNIGQFVQTLRELEDQHPVASLVQLPARVNLPKMPRKPRFKRLLFSTSVVCGNQGITIYMNVCIYYTHNRIVYRIWLSAIR